MPVFMKDPADPVVSSYVTLRFAYLAVLRVFGWLTLLARRHWAYPRRTPGRPRTGRMR
jgi:hypothetical protein